MLNVNNLYKTYRTLHNEYVVLKDVNLSITQGEFVAVMGPSGSGKTTLLNCISCYVPFEKGQISLGGQEIFNLTQDELAQVRNKKLGFVFQDFMLLDGLSVRENILLPAIIGGVVSKKTEERADRLCTVFDINDIKNKYPAEISGGEKQRTAVARALINEPLVILADEPTGNLDSKSSRIVINSFLSAKKNLGATIFMVTHDSFAASFCDRVIIMKDGTVGRSLKHNQTRNEIQDRIVFQDQLLEAIRELNEREED